MLTEKNERKLEYFANTMHHIIETKKQKAKQEAAAGLTKTASEALESITRRNKVLLKANQDEIKRNANRQTAQAKVQAIARYVKIRKNQIDHLFVEVQAQLAQFTQAAEYESYLIQRIKQVQTLSDFSIIQLSPHDMRLEKAIQSAAELVPEEGNHDFIGGFILLNEARSMQVDCTFKTLLSLAKKEFSYDTSCES